MGEDGMFFMNIDFNCLMMTFIGIFWSILFLQSGLDKVFDWKGNLGWLEGHFSKSPLATIVKPMLGTVTIIELLAGIISAIGVIQLWVAGSSLMLFVGLLFSTLSLIMLFFGQRIAKDYPGAQSIAIYFGIALLSFLLLLK